LLLVETVESDLARFLSFNLPIGSDCEGAGYEEASLGVDADPIGLLLLAAAAPGLPEVSAIDEYPCFLLLTTVAEGKGPSSFDASE
jgi:hypothetical protein